MCRICRHLVYACVGLRGRQCKGPPMHSPSVCMRSPKTACMYDTHLAPGPTLPALLHMPQAPGPTLGVQSKPCCTLHASSSWAHYRRAEPTLLHTPRLKLLGPLSACRANPAAHSCLKLPGTAPAGDRNVKLICPPGTTVFSTPTQMDWTRTCLIRRHTHIG